MAGGKAGNCGLSTNRTSSHSVRSLGEDVRLQFTIRVLGPLVLAVFAGVEIAAAEGSTAGGLGAYLTLVTAEAAIILWGHYQHRRARRRLAKLRASRR